VGDRVLVVVSRRAANASGGQRARTTIDLGRYVTPVGEHPKIPWRAVLTHPQVWLLGFILSCSAFNSYLYFFWYPTYLKKARGCEDVEAGWLSSLVLAGGAIGCMSGGFVIDWLTVEPATDFVVAAGCVSPWCCRRLGCC